MLKSIIAIFIIVFGFILINQINLPAPIKQIYSIYLNNLNNYENIVKLDDNNKLNKILFEELKFSEKFWKLCGKKRRFVSC